MDRKSSSLLEGIYERKGGAKKGGGEVKPLATKKIHCINDLLHITVSKQGVLSPGAN